MNLYVSNKLMENKRDFPAPSDKQFSVDRKKTSSSNLNNLYKDQHVTNPHSLKVCWQSKNPFPLGVSFLIHSTFGS